MVDKNHSDIESKVMSEIKGGRIKLRSKYIFLAEKLGLRSALALTVMIAVLFFSLGLFYLKATDNLWYLSFGSRGLFAFLESFPYLLVAIFVLAIFAAGLIVKRSGMAYHWPFGYVALIMLGVVIVAGIVLAYTNIFERIEREAFGGCHPSGRFFRPFLRPGIEERGRGIAGRIVEVGTGFLNIQTPFGIKKIDVTYLEEAPALTPVTGTFVMMVGERQDDLFVARALRVMNEGEMPMIGREIRRRFSPEQIPVPGCDGAPRPQPFQINPEIINK